MQKKLRQTLGLFAAAALTLASATSAWADTGRLLTENFSYDAGTELYGQGGWIRYGGNTVSPIKVSEGSLVYTGYIDEPVGHSVKLGETKSAEDLMHFFDGDVKIGSGSVYAAMLINMESIPDGTPAYFFNFVQESKAGLADGGNSSEVGRIYAQKSGSGYNLWVNRCTAFSTTGAVKCATDLSFNTTYLVVLKYEFVEGNTNDIVSLWVNPETGGEEPVADARYSGQSGSDINLNYGGMRGVELRQGTSASAVNPNVQIDALRVATSWAGLFGDDDTPTPPEEYTATITVDGGPFNHESAVNGVPYPAQAVISATGATEPVTITCSAGVTVDRTSIPVSELADGAPVTFTITPTATVSGPWSGTATLETAGAKTQTITFNAQVTVPVTVAQAVRFQNFYQDDNYDLYLYTGKAVVTYVERASQYGTDYDLVYAQDLTGAVCFSTASLFNATGHAIKVGDELTNCLVMVSPDAVGWQLMFFQMEEDKLPWTVSATGKEKTPVEINPSDFDPALNQYKLVKLSGVQFSATGNFEAKSYSVTADGGSATVRPFAGTDLIGTEVPASPAEVTGIAKSKSACIVWPRSAADVTAAAASAEITSEALFDFSNAAAPINEDTQIARITVKATGIKTAAPIEVTGTDAAMFSVSPTSIPAGSGTTVVTVTYHPTTAGKHNANIYFDFDGTDATLNRSVSLRGCMAYDPQHLPELSVTPAELTLRARVGETATAEATLHVANAFDYINAVKGDQSAQGIIIGSALYLPSISEQTVRVTFQPKVEGNVDQTFTFSTIMGQPVTLTVHGITTGGETPEDKEGDELVLNPAGAYSEYFQDFAGVQSNKPLDVAGWCNVAEEGTRAWWGYAGDGFTAAKVTAYDSKMGAGEGTPCKMLLVSPALGYADATAKVLKFRLMGKGLYEGMTDRLDICLVEQYQGETYITPMQGFDIPVTPDMDSTWIPYEVDMSVIDDMPDVFWIGFRFTSTRGRDNAAQYFVTDFDWGHPSTGIGSVTAPAEDGYTVYNLQGICVLKTADADALRTLPAGLYIINGRKHVIK